MRTGKQVQANTHAINKLETWADQLGQFKSTRTELKAVEDRIGALEGLVFNKALVVDKMISAERPQPIVRPGIPRGRTKARKAEDRGEFLMGAYLGGCFFGILVSVLYECGVVS